MDVLLVCLTAFLAAGVTLFSGFGLGTLVMPVFALFFPVELAISMTAIVHLLTNMLKVWVLGRYAVREVVLQFGVPAILAAFAGAWVLAHLVELSPLMQYRVVDYTFQVMPVKVAVGILLIVFALVESDAKEGRLVFDSRYLALGGIVSGFFGGLSGHQGALRSAFLIKAGLSKEGFLGSGVVIACLVDLARLVIYGASFPAIAMDEHLFILLAAVTSAFAGTWMANSFAHKTTIHTIQVIVSVMVIGIAVGLIVGMV
jgi:uncharacterized membrane protein YfcA